MVFYWSVSASKIPQVSNILSVLADLKTAGLHGLDSANDIHFFESLVVALRDYSVRTKTIDTTETLIF